MSAPLSSNIAKLFASGTAASKESVTDLLGSNQAFPKAGRSGFSSRLSELLANNPQLPGMNPSGLAKAGKQTELNDALNRLMEQFVQKISQGDLDGDQKISDEAIFKAFQRGLSSFLGSKNSENSQLFDFIKNIESHLDQLKGSLHDTLKDARFQKGLYFEGFSGDIFQSEGLMSEELELLKSQLKIIADEITQKLEESQPGLIKEHGEFIQHRISELLQGKIKSFLDIFNKPLENSAQDLKAVKSGDWIQQLVKDLQSKGVSKNQLSELAAKLKKIHQNGIQVSQVQMSSQANPLQKSGSNSSQEMSSEQWLSFRNGSLNNQGSKVSRSGGSDQMSGQSQNGAQNDGSQALKESFQNLFSSQSSQIQNKSAPSVFEQKLSQVDQQAAVDQLKDQSRLLIKKGGGEMRLQLNPKHLGKVDIQVIVNKNQVQLNLQAENRDVQSLLKEQLPELKASLGAQDLRLSKVDIGQLDQSHLRNQNREDQQQGSQQERREQMSERDAEREANSEELYSEMSFEEALAA